jgi:hypothetical protein
MSKHHSPLRKKQESLRRDHRYRFEGGVHAVRAWKQSKALKRRRGRHVAANLILKAHCRLDADRWDDVSSDVRAAARPRRLNKVGVLPLGELLRLRARGHNPIY